MTRRGELLELVQWQTSGRWLRECNRLNSHEPFAELGMLLLALEAMP